MFELHFFSSENILEEKYSRAQTETLRRIINAAKYLHTHPDSMTPFGYAQEDIQVVRIILEEYAKEVKCELNVAADFYLSRLDLCGAAHR